MSAESKSQVSIEYLVIIGGIVVLATAVFFVVRGLMGSSGEELGAEQQEAFGIIRGAIIDTQSKVVVGAKKWCDEESSYRTVATIKNPFDKAVEDVKLLYGKDLPPGVKKGTVGVFELRDRNLLPVDFSEVSVSAGCTYKNDDYVAFRVGLGPKEEKTFYVCSSEDYFGNKSCTSLSEDVVLPGLETDGTMRKRIVFSQPRETRFFFVGNLSISGTGRVTSEKTGRSEELSKTAVEFESEKTSSVLVYSNNFTLTIRGNLVFEEGTVFEDEQTFFFLVPSCLEEFEISLTNNWAAEAPVVVLDSLGNYVNGSEYFGPLVLNPQSSVDAVLPVKYGGVWRVLLPGGVGVSFSGLPENTLSFSRQTVFVPDLESMCLNVGFGNVSWGEKPDKEPPKVNASQVRPLDADSNDLINITLFVADEDSFLFDCVAKSEGRCMRGCVMRPSDAHYDNYSEVVFAELGVFAPGEPEVEVSCRDEYLNRVSETFSFSVREAPDLTPPDFVGEIMLSPASPSSLDILSFSAEAVDAVSPVKRCSYLIKKKTSLYTEGFLRETEGDYGRDNRVVVRGVLLDPLEIGEYSVKIDCEDSEKNANYATLSFTVRDGEDPVVRNFSTNPVEAQTMFVAINSPVAFMLRISDNAGVDKCSFSRLYPLASEYSKPLSISCSEGCGSNLSSYSFTTSNWPVGGDYNVSFVCSDSAGNRGYYNTTVRVRDLDSPEIVSFEYSPEAPKQDRPVVFEATILDDVNVTDCDLEIFEKHVFPTYWRRESVALFENLSLISNRGGSDFSNVSVTMSVEGLNDSIYIAKLTCDDDSAANSVSYQEVEFIVDSLGPSVYFNVTPVIANPSQPVRVELQTRDFVSGIRECVVDFGDSKNSTCYGSCINTHVYGLLGQFTVSVLCTDNVGNTNYTTVSLKTDSEHPVVWFNTPTTPTKSHSISYTLTVADFGRAKLVDCAFDCDARSYFVDYPSCPGICNGSVYRCSYPDGWRVPVAVCVDEAGNYNYSLFNVTIDTQPPIVRRVDPTDFASWSSSSAQVFEASLYDVGLGIDFSQSKLWVAGEAGTSSDNGFDKLFFSPQSTLPTSQQMYMVWVAAVDVVGNQRLVSKRFTISDTATDLVVSKPLEGSFSKSDSIQVEGQTTPDLEVVVSKQGLYFWDSETVTVTSDFGGRFSASITSLHNGENIINVTVFDDPRSETRITRSVTFDEIDAYVASSNPSDHDVEYSSPRNVSVVLGDNQGFLLQNSSFSVRTMSGNVKGVLGRDRNSTLFFYPQKGFPAGTYTLSVTLVDKAGNSDQETLTFTVVENKVNPSEKESCGGFPPSDNMFRAGCGKWKTYTVFSGVRLRMRVKTDSACKNADFDIYEKEAGEWVFKKSVRYGQNGSVDEDVFYTPYSGSLNVTARGSFVDFSKGGSSIPDPNNCFYLDVFEALEPNFGVGEDYFLVARRVLSNLNSALN